MGKKAKLAGVLFTVVLLLLAISLPGLTAKERAEEDSFSSYVSKIKLESAEKSKNIAIFPITLPGSRDLSINNLLTLDEAITRGGLVVKELEPESVNQLMVANSSSNWIYIMAGEILTGSKQDRILKDDLLLPPKSGKIVVNAYCVEHGRWTYKSETFSSNKTLSNIAVRQRARETSDQSMVWKSIEETQKSTYAGAAMPSTAALNETYKAPAVEKNIDSLYDHFKNLPKEHPSMSGAVVAIGDKILCVDFFGDRDMFRNLWPKLLKSYLLEATSSRETGVSIDKSDCQGFIEKIRKAALSSTDAPGEGVVLTVNSKDVTGSALMYKGDLLHSDIFPKTGLAPETRKSNDVQNVQPIHRQYR